MNTKLRKFRPEGVDLTACEFTTYGDLRLRGAVEWANLDEDAPVAVLPGWSANDEGGDEYYPAARSAQEAANTFFDDSDWDHIDSTVWPKVHVYRKGIALDWDGDPVNLVVDEEVFTTQIDPDEPECDSDEHDWQSPLEVVGGIAENPGVWGHGGGVIIKEVCSHCGAYRIKDTWAQDPTTGAQGLTSIRYEDPDDVSASWVQSLRNQ